MCVYSTVYFLCIFSIDLINHNIHTLSYIYTCIQVRTYNSSVKCNKDEKSNKKRNPPQINGHV